MNFLATLGQGAKQIGQNFLQNEGIMPMPGAPDPNDPNAKQNPQAGPKKGHGFGAALGAMFHGQQKQQGPQAPSYVQATAPDGSYMGDPGTMPITGIAADGTYMGDPGLATTAAQPPGNAWQRIFQRFAR